MDAIMDNYFLSTETLFEYDEKKIAVVHENEDFIDKCETSLNDYLLLVANRNLLTGDLRRYSSELLNSVSDLERIGDHCDALAHLATEMNESGVQFSEKGKAELKLIMGAVEKVLDLSFTAFKTDDPSVSLRVEILSEMIDELKETIKEHHVNRLQTGECSVEAGFTLLDILTDLERMGKHSTNIAHHITKRFSVKGEFDEMHGRAYSIQVKKTEDYKALYMYYEQMYLQPVRKYDAKGEEELEAAETPEQIEELKAELAAEAQAEAEAAAEAAVTEALPETPAAAEMPVADVIKPKNKEKEKEKHKGPIKKSSSADKDKQKKKDKDKHKK